MPHTRHITANRIQPFRLTAPRIPPTSATRPGAPRLEAGPPASPAPRTPVLNAVAVHARGNPDHPAEPPGQVRLVGEPGQRRGLGRAAALLEQGPGHPHPVLR